MLLDSIGVPYGKGDLVWDGVAGVRLDDFVAPGTFEMPEGMYDRSGDFQSGAVTHYGYPLSRFAQQLMVLKFLRDSAGFDPLVWCVADYGVEKCRVCLDTVTGLWKEL